MVFLLQMKNEVSSNDSMHALFTITLLYTLIKIIVHHAQTPRVSCRPSRQTFPAVSFLSLASRGAQQAVHTFSISSIPLV